jgi:ribosomal-protein-alanine N-acetyltransferase
MVAFEITKALPANIDSICAIQTECRLSAWTPEGYEAEMARPDSIILAAFSGSKELIGFIAGRVIPGSADLRAEAEIYNVGVRPRFQKQGVGGELIREFIRRSRDFGVGGIWLDVRKSNSTAISFYLRHGFLKKGRRKSFYTEPLEDAEIMCLLVDTSQT